MRIDILTLFPEIFAGPFSSSLLKKAQEKNLITINIINIRDFAEDKHKTADDAPYGGGPGMVMKSEPIYKAVSRISGYSNIRIVLMCPTGKPLTQQIAKELSQEDQLIVICGHYEGIDERIRKNLVTDEISIGDYVLTGGEVPAMVLVDAVARLIPGVVKEEESIVSESFFEGLLDYPSYTRPEEFMGERVPAVLTSGHHKEIARWRRMEALKRTFSRRPDLLPKAQLTEEDKQLFEEILNGG